jgi:hypothetical protein
MAEPPSSPELVPAPLLVPVPVPPLMLLVPLPELTLPEPAVDPALPLESTGEPEPPLGVPVV